MSEEQKEEQHEHIMSMQRIMEECFINLNEKIEHPPVAISYKTKEIITKDGEMKEFPIPIGTYGNFSFVQAPPKHMKTFFSSLISSVYCNPEGKNTVGLNSFREGRELVHFDTEQGKWHAQRVFKRPQWMNKTSNLDFYHTFGLRGVSFSEQINFIEFYLEHLSLKGKKIGLVIIDGIADLVLTVNDEESSKEITDRIMKLTVMYDCHIFTIIHSNPNSDKPTGHLGSHLERKAETQILLDRNPNKLGAITVSCKRSRNTPFEQFDFRLDENGLPKVDNPDDVYSF